MRCLRRAWHRAHDACDVQLVKQARQLKNAAVKKCKRLKEKIREKFQTSILSSSADLAADGDGWFWYWMGLVLMDEVRTGWGSHLN